MGRLKSVRALPVRSKLLLTVLGTAAAALGASTHFSFRYWEAEAVAAARRQALLAAVSTRASLQSAVRMGRLEMGHYALVRLREDAGVTRARVYADDGTILISTDAWEEGTRSPTAFLPEPRLVPDAGIVRSSDGGRRIRAFVRVDLPEPAILEVEMGPAPTVAAMNRGARLSIGLMAASLVLVGVMIVTLFEREVFRPLHRIDVLLRGRAPRDTGAGSDLEALERSVEALVEREANGSAARDRHLAEREGLAQVGELAAEMAHEFKRPLASIRTAVSVLEQEYALDEGGRDVLAAVHTQVERLSDTMQDLFSLARPLDIDPEPVSLAGVTDEALLEFAGLPCAHGIEVTRDYRDPLPPVPADRRRLRQAILNLLTNAAEAMGGSGPVTVSLRAADDGSRVSVAVQDAGPGLSPDEVERVLRPFYSTKPTGTGLGLPLVARIVSAHRGGLSFESRPGSGTTVRITLPVHSPPSDGPRSHA